MGSRERATLAYRAPSQRTEAFVRLPSGVHRVVAESVGAVLLETSRAGDGEARSYLFREPVRVLTADTPGQVRTLFEEIEAAGAEGLYAAGYVAYECGFGFEPAALAAGDRVGGGEGMPLAWFGIYRAPLVFDHGSGAFESHEAGEFQGHEAGEFDGLREMRELEGGGLGAEVCPELEISAEVYAELIERIRRRIEAGETYQANLTTRLRMNGVQDAAALFSHMMRAQPVEFGAMLNLGERQILSASPELFFRREGERIEMRPMKGTTTRGLSSEEDEERARWLANDPKNRSENVMIVDLLRNDLGRVSRMGSVRAEEMFTVERYPTVLQMVSTVRGLLRGGVSSYELFERLFPSGSIVGAPKIRTMQILRELEGGDRGVYTGAIGMIAPGERSTFSVAIRTVVLDGEEAVMGVGSGVVYDSDARSEYEECRSKARFLTERTPAFQLIETMLWDGEYSLLDRHMRRLAGSAEYFDRRLDVGSVCAVLGEKARGFRSGQRMRVRLLVDEDGGLQVSCGEISAAVEAEVAVAPATERVRSGDVFLRHKTTVRGIYDSAYSEAQTMGCADAILLNERGEVTEGAIHNVVVVRSGVWMTPPVSAGLLPGVYRAYLMESRGVVERTLRWDDLASADEVYLCNSLRGLRRVERIVDGCCT